MSARPAVIDSSGWIELFTDGPQAGSFVAVLDSGATLVVPVMADSIILATARSHRARLHTMDADFRGLGGDVERIEKLAWSTISPCPD